MVLNQNPFEGLVKIIITLVVLGVIIGLLVAGNDYLNSANAAKAERIRIENEIMKEKADIELAQQKQLAQVELEADIQMLQNRVRLHMAIGWALLGVALFLALTFITSTAIILVTAAEKQLNNQPAMIKSASEWDSPRYKAARIEEARQRELRALRIAAAHPYKVLRISSKDRKTRLN
jgi:hypothetical protein